MTDTLDTRSLESPPDSPHAAPAVVARLEALLAAARAGEIRGLAFAVLGSAKAQWGYDSLSNNDVLLAAARLAALAVQNEADERDPS